MFKKRKVRQARRQRKEEKSSSDDESTQIVRIEKKDKSLNKQSSKKVYAAKSDDEDDMRAFINKKYKSNMNKDPILDKDNIATSEAADLGPIMDIKEKTKRDDEIQKGLQAGTLDDSIYRGKGGYRNYHKIRSEAHTKESLAIKGPVRGNSFFRASIRIDHDPCICKDYKETGFCGFGDSCKFIHDRGDYKLGWMIEREQELGIYGQTEEENWEVSSDEEDLPFKCIICRNHFKKPVVTKCEHYFCEACALEQYKKTKRCFVCQKNTKGIFNMAKHIVAKLLKIELKDVKMSHWENRIVAKESEESGSDADRSGDGSEGDDTEDKKIEEEKTREDLLELERLEDEERLRKKQHEKDILTGKVIATETRMPIAELGSNSSSDSDDNLPSGMKRKHLLKTYDPENLENNFKKQREKVIKNEIEPGYQPPVFTDSSEVDSDEGVIRDPALYNPRDFENAPEPTHTQNALELAQQALINRRQVKVERDHADLAHKEMLERMEVERLKIEESLPPVVKVEDERLRIEESLAPHVKEEENYIKLEPEDADMKSDEGALLEPVDLPTTNPTLNILNPTAGAKFIPKQVKPRRNASNPIAQNIQAQAKNNIPERSNKKRKNYDQPVRDHLPNMNPYTHRMKEKKTNFQKPEIAPLPVQPDVKLEPIQPKKKKMEEPVEDDDWDDLPSNLMTIESVSNKDWRRN